MKPRVPGAGSRFFRRRQLLGAASATGLLALAAGCAPSTAGRRESVREATGGLLTQMRSLTGAQILTKTTQTGMPSGRSSLGGFVPFVFPVAVAATPLDIYVADAGAGRLYRYDPALNAMAVFPVPVTPQTRLAAGLDGSILVVTPQAGFPLRFDRAGNPLQQINANTGSDHYDDATIDPVSGRFYALDRIQRRIDEIHPVGRVGVVLADRQMPDNPVSLAMDRRMLFVSSRACACVVQIDRQTGRQQAIIEDLKDMAALAAGGGWVAVADSVQRHLFIYRDGMLRGEPSYESLRLANPQGVAIVNDSLYVADGAGRRVVQFGMRP
ncbi:MAG: hypothetical protein RKP46_13180 [Candidatus Accumulibacter sp.]|uniref:hypothetical protein n=1 Tax=Accumulibacter sp. TaxID=2053492 RepID=UPI002878A735|nr:hypothetical protein [Accumulibacter sp.]MDS4015279.1 hypothetical protein [Accumulibacter sp.]